MVQKIIDNEIIDRYKINRCIPTIPKIKNKSNRIVKGGSSSTVGDDLYIPSGNVLFIIFYIIILILVNYYLFANNSISNIWILIINQINFIIIIYYIYNYIYSSSSYKEEDSMKNKILNIILGEERKITKIHQIILISIIVFILLVVITISARVLLWLISGKDKNNCLKDLKLENLKPINILLNNSTDNKTILNNQGSLLPTPINVNNDYFDLKHFVKPPSINKENTISADAGVIFNPNNPGAPGVPVGPIPAPGGVTTGVINIGTAGNNQGSLFDNRIKVVEKDIYSDNDYFDTRPTELKNKLKKYFRYIFEPKQKRHFLTFEVDGKDIGNTFLSNIFIK